MQSREFSILSFGGGQDSTALLYLYLNSLDFRITYAPKRLIVVMGATLNEHPATDAHVENIKVLCRERGIEFIHVTPDMGYHTGAWKGGLVGQWSKNHTIGSAAYPKSCTVALKTAPVWRAVEAVIERDYGYPANDKRGLRAFSEEFGTIPCLIGIAAGEEKRLGQRSNALMLPFGPCADVPPPKKDPTPKWLLECVNRIYPLIDLGFDRAACQRYIASLGEYVPPPSNCVFCPYKSHQEVLWTERKFPEMFALWVSLEAAKLKHWADAVDEDGNPIPNYGVKGKKTLIQFHQEAVARYGHYTMTQLEEYIFSHGHCVASKH